MFKSDICECRHPDLLHIIGPRNTCGKCACQGFRGVRLPGWWKWPLFVLVVYVLPLVAIIAVTLSRP